MGICMVAKRNSSIMQRIICPSVLSSIKYVSQHTVSFEFDRDDLDPAIIMRRFLDPFFLVEESFALPIYLVRKWSLNTRWVSAGVYPVLFQDNSWRIQFNLDYSCKRASFKTFLS